MPRLAVSALALAAGLLVPQVALADSFINLHNESSETLLNVWYIEYLGDGMSYDEQFPSSLMGPVAPGEVYEMYPVTDCPADVIIETTTAKYVLQGVAMCPDTYDFTLTDAILHGEQAKTCPFKDTAICADL